MAYTSADFAKEVLVVPSSFRPGLAILAAALLTTSVALAFNAPLSDEAVREAYLLGQRRDDSLKGQCKTGHAGSLQNRP